MNNSKLFSLDWKDAGKGAIIAVLVPVFAKLAEVMGAPGFDFVTFQWSTLFSIGVSAFLAYLLKNFTQDRDGTPFGSAR